VTADRLAGSLLGQALGDALGFVVEAEPPQVARSYVENWLRTGRGPERRHPRYPFGQYTDDTQLARELLCSYREVRGWDPATFADKLAQLFHRGRDVGAGLGSRSAAMRLIQGVPWSDSGTPAPYAGNGSAMRAGQLGLLFTHTAEMRRVAREQSRITHQDRRCSAGAVAIAHAVALAACPTLLDPAAFVTEVARVAGAEDQSVAAAVSGLADWLSLPPDHAADAVRDLGLDPGHQEWQGISSLVSPSVVWSLYAFLRSPDDYWETICTAIAVGGDTDSMAAMAGAMSGARGGLSALPRDLLAHLTDQGEWGATELIELARDCGEIASARSR
jgi:ADP-ribosylglycohydrolase